MHRGFAVGQTFLVFRKDVVWITVEPAFARLRGGRELDARQAEAYFRRGEQHALSVFFRIGDEVFHTYSTYARGTESLTDAYSLLDTTRTDDRRILKTRRRAGRRGRPTVKGLARGATRVVQCT